MPDDLKAQTVQWVITTARSLQMLPLFSTISGVDPVQSEQGLRDVEKALAEYRASPGTPTRANISFFPTAVEVGQIALSNPRLLIPMLVLIAVAAGAVILSNAQRRAHANLNQALERWANRLFIRSRRRPVTVTDVQALDKRVREDMARSGRGGRCQDHYEAYLRALARVRQVLNSPTLGGIRGIALALAALQAALEALYGCLGVPLPPARGF
jgi:hypothetical protein